MTPDFLQMEFWIKKFYQKENSFYNFSDLTEDRLSELAKKVYAMQETMDVTIFNKQGKILKLEKYRRTLQYLTNERIRFDLNSFDEKIAFLIMMTDPNLITFKEFLKINLVSLSEIEKESPINTIIEKQRKTAKESR